MLIVAIKHNMLSIIMLSVAYVGVVIGFFHPLDCGSDPK
jgi:hypothetical protein